MARQMVTETEYELMKVLWKAEKPLSLGEILTEVREKNWVRNTVGTMLSRLCDKGVVAYERKGKTNLYYAVLPEQEYSMNETRSFLSRLYHGSVGTLVASLYQNKEISQDDIAILKKIIDGEK
ncbi:BlaI/MecI/CopY family transcriptional regulator [Ructibacterium gallinarum]|uniref:BlaI/MecI/CopY family transcriptional regulator n=1 Tax=Ructibacterium gallinarum TaxID=2779355 RepID=A0A9D5LZL3_9FIRM|nr:BlaI/MecI/CopY family transcriptional regulator [Ructibacterium gallinarum]MBE5039426.1 BlaI/MecI/CopY family transcriptional regulator [Ructibacterium gallinarum]